MVGLSDITDGHATSLASSALLADIILGGTAEEVGLQSLAQQFEADIVSIKETLKERGRGVEVTDEEVASEFANHLKLKNVQTKAWKCDGKMSDSRADYFSKNTLLSAARKEIEVSEPLFSFGAMPGMTRDVAAPSSVFRDFGSSSAHIEGVREFTFSRNLPMSAPMSSATSSRVEVEDVSHDQAQRIYSRMKKQGKV
jgi:hypothetical protein